MSQNTARPPRNTVSPMVSKRIQLRSESGPKQRKIQIFKDFEGILGVFHPLSPSNIFGKATQMRYAFELFEQPIAKRLATRHPLVCLL